MKTTSGKIMIPTIILISSGASQVVILVTNFVGVYHALPYVWHYD